MNHDFDIHVVNKTMKQRFQKKRNCTDEFMMMSKMKSFSILAYDRMRINVSTFKEKSTMKLLNVCYVFDFMINIVASNILADKELHFDTTHDHLHRNDTSIVLVSKVDAHYVFENNRSEEMNIFAAFVRKDTISEEVAEEMKLTNKNKMSLINKCEKTKFSLSSESALMFTSSNTSAKTNSKFSLSDTSKAKLAERTASELVTITTIAESTSKKSIF